jgi:hypothetical protein
MLEKKVGEDDIKDTIQIYVSGYNHFFLVSSCSQVS